MKILDFITCINNIICKHFCITTITAKNVYHSHIEYLDPVEKSENTLKYFGFGKFYVYFKRIDQFIWLKDHFGIWRNSENTAN